MKRFIYLLALVALCGSNILVAQTDSILIKRVAAIVSPDSAFDNLERLTGVKETVIDGEPYLIKSRRNTSEGNHKAARFLYQKFFELGYTPEIRYYDDYQSQNYPASPAENVWAISRGDENPEKYVVICAHYDSEGDLDESPGADDNASGVTAVLEAARVFKNLKHKYTVIFACFDHEEFGPSGAGFFADSLKKTGITNLQCINVDMLGYYGKENKITMIFQDTSHFSQPLVDMILKAGEFVHTTTDLIASDTYTMYGDKERLITIGMGDDIAFIRMKYQAVMFCEPPAIEVHNPNYHSKNDKAVAFMLPYYFDNIKLSVAATALAAGVYEIKASPEGIENDSQDLIITPNPASQYISVRNIEIGPDNSIEIYSQLGEKVSESKGTPTVEIDALTPGIYFVRVCGRICKFVKI